jgi:Zn-dependent protease
MAILTLHEIIDLIVMTAAVGFIFYDVFQRFRPHKHDIYIKRFDLNDFLFACLITAPGIIFHELAHKFVALAFGYAATFKAAYGWLGIGLAMKMLNFGFIFFVPGYVEIPGITTGLKMSAIAFAGPGLNGLLWLVSYIALRSGKVNRRYLPALYLTRQINGFLFIFNMLPIPLFDGFKVYQGIISALS